MNKNKITKIFIIVFFVVFSINLLACGENKSDESELLRLHIRADSNSEADQAVKLKVRDKVVAYLDAELGEIDDFDTAKREISKRGSKIKSICDSVLQQNGFSYRATVSVRNEFFPTRMYETLVVESGYYDALIIELGSGKGDNWWCVIYPPLCYVEATYGSGFRYKSKIKELIEKYFN
jgi:stage II sporulation protein R